MAAAVAPLQLYGMDRYLPPEGSLAAVERLPLVGQGTLIMTKHPLKYFSRTASSLPDLESYSITGRGRKRYGEDEDIERAGFDVATSGFSRLRNNFDHCEVTEKEIQNDDINAIREFQHQYGPAELTDPPDRYKHFGSKYTTRFFPMDPKFSVYPRIDHCRTEGPFVLTRATREAVDNCYNTVYRTPRYADMYQDTTDHLRRQTQRDNLYHLEGPNYHPRHTCSGVFAHPDPCPFCWRPRHTRDPKPHQGCWDRMPKDCELPKAKQDHTKPCNRCQKVDCIHKDHCHSYIKKPEQPMSVVDFDSICRHNIEYINCNICVSETTGASMRTATSTDDANNSNMESIGPWQYTVKKGALDERVFTTDTPLPTIPTARPEHKPEVSRFLATPKPHKIIDPPPEVNMQHRAPSTTQLRPTSQNDNDPNFLERWRKYYHTEDDNRVAVNMSPWQMICQAKRPPDPISHRNLNNSFVESLDLDFDKVPAPPPPSSRNTWTNRDVNNLRVPSIARTTGILDKSQTIARYHDMFPDPVPDYRVNHRYSTRINFNGFNSAVFHG